MTSVLDAKILAARAVGELARRAGRGGGTSLPGKVLTRLEPRADELLARPAGGWDRGDLGHQREDHRRPRWPRRF